MDMAGTAVVCCSLYIVEYWALKHMQHKDALHTRHVVSTPRSMLHTLESPLWKSTPKGYCDQAWGTMG